MNQVDELFVTVVAMLRKNVCCLTLTCGSVSKFEGLQQWKLLVLESCGSSLILTPDCMCCCLIY